MSKVITSYAALQAGTQLTPANASIATIMEHMDKQYRSRFCEWVSDEINMETIVFHFGRMVQDYRQDKVAIHRAVRWLTSHWDVQTTCNFIIRVFYSWGLGSQEFGELVAAIVEDWEIEPYTVQLVVNMCTGERPEQCAAFFRHLCQDWEQKDLLDLVSSVSYLSEWSNSYFQSFIISFVDGFETKVMSPENIRDQFLHHVSERVTSASPLMNLSHREFGLLLFEIALAEIKEELGLGQLGIGDMKLY
jgi:hypothetical protein